MSYANALSSAFVAATLRRPETVVDFLKEASIYHSPGAVRRHKLWVMRRDGPALFDCFNFAASIVIAALFGGMITGWLVAAWGVLFGGIDYAIVRLLEFSIVIGCFVWVEAEIPILPRWTRCKLSGSCMAGSSRECLQALFSSNGDLHYVFLPREAWDACDTVRRRYPQAQFEVELFGGDPILKVRIPGEWRAHAITIWDRDIKTGEVTMVYPPR